MMRWKMLVSLAAAALLAAGASNLVAQDSGAGNDSGSKMQSASETISGKYKDQYTKDQFDAVDSDGDGFISRAEAKGASSQAERDLFGSGRFDKADADGDGRLSPQEAHTLRKKEASNQDLGTTKAKHRREYKGAHAKGSRAVATDPEGRKRTGKRKRYEEASAKRRNENPRVVKKQENTKRRHRARRPADAGD